MNPHAREESAETHVGVGTRPQGVYAARAGALGGSLCAVVDLEIFILSLPCVFSKQVWGK